MHKKILIYGYGNPGRQDDGLGNAFIEQCDVWLKEQGIEGIGLDSNYQLNIEDADAIADKDVVVFVDASLENIEDILFTEVHASGAKIEFSMHAVSPAFVLSLCHNLYNKYPNTYLLHIKGYEWDFKEGLSEKAAINLNKAMNFMKKKILNNDLLKP